MRSHNLIIPILLTLSPVTTLCLMAPAPAHAQTPVFTGTGLIELLPANGVIGDGATANDMYLLAVGPDGNPLSGLKLKPTVTGGTATELSDVGGGCTGSR